MVAMAVDTLGRGIGLRVFASIFMKLKARVAFMLRYPTLVWLASLTGAVVPGFMCTMYVIHRETPSTLRHCVLEGVAFVGG